jgi:menaquinone-dependent protoporphyrinogen IX oxidase
LTKLGRLTVIGEPEKDSASYDLVVVGTPIWAGAVAPAIRTYLSQNKERLKRVASF